MHLKELKAKNPSDLLLYAESLDIENASNLRKQDMMFACLKTLAENDVAIYGNGVLEVLSDGFGFLRSPESNYLAGPDDIYVSPSQIRKFGLRTGDTVEGEIRSPKDGERYFALLKIETINFENPENLRQRINFDNLTPLYPENKINFEVSSDEKQGTPNVLNILQTVVFPLPSLPNLVSPAIALFLSSTLPCAPFCSLLIRSIRASDIPPALDLFDCGRPPAPTALPFSFPRPCPCFFCTPRAFQRIAPSAEACLETL